jgi:predicted PurR-regulated permease PerM
MDSYDILVVTLSIALAVSVIVWIVVGVLVVQIMRRLRTLTDSAQHAADNVQEFTEQLKKAGKMSAAGSAIAQITKIFKGRGN